ncbi:hypothetical protein [Thalassobacillus sp. CUG 92003]|uniref:hypothetical protein n=1 Tax=Thalassobacillus sp. CUG 92003 TaxID=2736641 RepID=UPI0015E72916|nr:hypothetical protein [Thalassobacillus sp. CUG 92003]
MNTKQNTSKLSLDLFLVQGKWAAWFLSTVCIIYVVFRMVVDQNQISFFPFAFQPSKIFMLILGIMSPAVFLTFYVRQGITRRDYFYGSALAAIALSLALSIIASIISGFQHLLTGSQITVHMLNDEASLPLIMFSFFLNVLVYFAAGWLVGAGIYRSGWLIGLGHIVLAMVIVSLSDLFWEGDMSEPWLTFFNVNAADISIAFSFIVTLLLLTGTFWLVRLLTRNVTVKMK